MAENGIVVDNWRIFFHLVRMFVPLIWCMDEYFGGSGIVAVKKKDFGGSGIVAV